MIYSFFRVQFLQVLRYAAAMESLALSLLPVFATALDLDENFFEEAFESPMFRLRLSHYPPASKDTDQYGIAPHTDTSFLTLLAQVGLVSYKMSPFNLELRTRKAS